MNENVNQMYPDINMDRSGSFFIRNVLYWPHDDVNVSARLLFVTEDGKRREIPVRVEKEGDFYLCVDKEGPCVDRMVAIKTEYCNDLLSFESMECMWTICVKRDGKEGVLEHIYVHRDLNWYFPLAGDCRFFVSDIVVAGLLVYLNRKLCSVSFPPYDVIAGYDETGACFCYEGCKERLSDTVDKVLHDSGLLCPTLLMKNCATVYSLNSKVVAMSEDEAKRALKALPETLASRKIT